MGADQVKEQGEQMVPKFFNAFYWFIQVGSIFAFTVVVYVQQVKKCYFFTVIWY